MKSLEETASFSLDASRPTTATDAVRQSTAMDGLQPDGLLQIHADAVSAAVGATGLLGQSERGVEHDSVGRRSGTPTPATSAGTVPLSTEESTESLTATDSARSNTRRKGETTDSARSNTRRKGEETAGPKPTRKVYYCSKCGAPKRGHVCSVEVGSEEASSHNAKKAKVLHGGMGGHSATAALPTHPAPHRIAPYRTARTEVPNPAAKSTQS